MNLAKVQKSNDLSNVVIIIISEITVSGSSDFNTLEFLDPIIGHKLFTCISCDQNWTRDGAQIKVRGGEMILLLLRALKVIASSSLSTALAALDCR